MSKRSEDSGQQAQGSGKKQKKRKSLIEPVDVSWTDQIPLCPTYSPTEEEFEDPFQYLQTISQEASRCGICKIVCPWKAGVPAAEMLKHIEFNTYVQPLRLGRWDKDDIITYLLSTRKNTYKSFKRRADEEIREVFRDPGEESPDSVEKKFWRKMIRGGQSEVEYAINIDGSAFPNRESDSLGSSKWNFRILALHNDSLLKCIYHKIGGVNTPMLYIGMIFSMFAWHMEDHYLYSVNYNHCGAPKTWYGVRPDHATQFEEFCLQKLYAPEILSPPDLDGVFKMISNKTTMFPPNFLLENGIPVCKAVQMAGEFVITFPKAYHCGFSHGFNCAEALNFATIDWLPFGSEVAERYAKLGIQPIVPYEEVLCQSMNQPTLSLSEGNDFDVSLRKLYITHVRTLLNALHRLAKLAENLLPTAKDLSEFHSTVLCAICKRDCYLAFLECNKCLTLNCLFHNDIKSLDCPCGGIIILHRRKDLEKAEQMVQEQESLSTQPNYPMAMEG